MKSHLIKILTLFTTTVLLYGCATTSPSADMLATPYWKNFDQKPNNWKPSLNLLDKEELFVKLVISGEGIEKWAIITQPEWIRTPKSKGLICVMLANDNQVGLCDVFGSGGFFHDSNRRIEWDKVRTVAKAVNEKLIESYTNAKTETENNIKTKKDTDEVKNFINYFSGRNHTDLLELSINYDNAEMANYIYKRQKSLNISNFDLFQKYKIYTLKNNQYEPLLYLGQQGDKDALKAAYSLAPSDQRDKLIPKYFSTLTDGELNEAYKNASSTDKVKIEKVIVPRFAQRLANIKYTVANAKTQAYGANDTSLGSQLLSLLGTKVGVAAETPVTYTVQLNPALFKVQGSYNFKAQIVLRATGKETYQTNCMWPLPKVCDNENNSAVKIYTKNISGTLYGNTIHNGSTSIEWKPKFANKSMGGLETTFVTSDVSVSLTSLSIEPIN
jgi:hypothetical protein